MITLFRKLRLQLLSEGRFSRYLIYASGEIVLVVIGILIALEINNANELAQQRDKEIQFLQSLESDLVFEQRELERFIQIRQDMLSSAQIVLGHFDGERVSDIHDFNRHVFTVGVWQEFQRNNNTFQELLNSGNLTIISNKAIKDGLLNLDLIYKAIVANREHLRNDLEQYFYDRWFRLVDLDSFAQSFLAYANSGAYDRGIELSREQVDAMLADTVFKNGFVVAVFTVTLIIEDYQRMQRLNLELVEMIQQEIAGSR